MVKVLVGSRNRVKLEAAEEVFSDYFGEVEVIGLEVDGMICGQPLGGETLEGATNRALEVRRINDEESLNAKFFVGVEGGILKLASKWFALSVTCIMDDAGRTGYGTSPMFELPGVIAQQLLEGSELGDVMDRVTGQRGTKEGQGAAGFFTKGVMDRKRICADGLVAALVPFLNEDLYLR
jgi:inosine/xanthosine triphosphatase